MNRLKRAILLVVIVLIAVINIIIYLNQHLYYKSLKDEDLENRINLLELSKKVYPLNDLTYLELGKTYYARGVSNLAKLAESDSDIQKSIESYRQSIRINPFSQFNHFHLARSLFYMDLLSKPTDLDYFDEYRKAANLVRFNSQIHFEVGKLFLSAWKELSEADKRLTLMMMRGIWRVMDREKILSLLKVWEMNVKDYEIIREVLPNNPDAYSMYAAFLGESSLDLEERHRILSEYDFIEFERAKQRYELGEKSLYYYRVREAFSHFSSCLVLLDRIRFYQDLSSKSLISRKEFFELKKSTFLNLAKSLIEEGREWGDYKDYLQKYIDLESINTRFSELENFLYNRNVLEEQLSGNYGDLERLIFQLRLYFKQNRYREIIRIGRSFQSSLSVMSDDENEFYIQIMQLVGDAYQKVGNLYDAGDVYETILEIDPNNHEALFNLRQNLRLLNDTRRIAAINTRINNILSSERIIIENQLIAKESGFAKNLIFEGGRIALNFRFEKDWEEKPPLISVIINKEVVWENYLHENELIISIETLQGRNSIRVATINQPIVIRSLIWQKE